MLADRLESMNDNQKKVNEIWDLLQLDLKTRMPEMDDAIMWRFIIHVTNELKCAAYAPVTGHYGYCEDSKYIDGVIKSAIFMLNLSPQHEMELIKWERDTLKFIYSFKEILNSIEGINQMLDERYKSSVSRGIAHYVAQKSSENIRLHFEEIEQKINGLPDDGWSADWSAKHETAAN